MGRIRRFTSTHAHGDCCQHPHRCAPVNFNRKSGSVATVLENAGVWNRKLEENSSHEHIVHGTTAGSWVGPRMEIPHQFVHRMTHLKNLTSKRVRTQRDAEKTDHRNRRTSRSASRRRAFSFLKVSHSSNHDLNYVSHLKKHLPWTMIQIATERSQSHKLNHGSNHALNHSSNHGLNLKSWFETWTNSWFKPLLNFVIVVQTTI